MKLSDLFNLASNRSDAWNNLWQLYIGISTALLAIVSASSKALTKPSSAIICFGFIAFVAGNYSAFLNYHKTRKQIHKMIVEQLSDERYKNISENTYNNSNEIETLSNLIGPPLKYIGNKPAFFYYYWIISAVVLLSLWFIPLLRS
nr:hypothetical protein [uncultured Desulfobacter sp.]